MVFLISRGDILERIDEEYFSSCCVGIGLVCVERKILWPVPYINKKSSICSMNDEEIVTT